MPQLSELMHAVTQLISLNTTMAQQQTTAKALGSNFTVMPDLTKAITNYDGRGASGEAREWLDNIESMARLHHWPEAFLYESATMHLVGAARAWFGPKRSTFKSWTEFREAFKKTFIPALDYTETWNRLQNRTQREDEDAVDYYYDKLRLCKLLGLDFAESKRQIAAGLRSKDAMSHAMSTNHTDEDSLFHGIVSFERVVRQHSHTFARGIREQNKQFTEKTRSSEKQKSRSSQSTSHPMENTGTKCYNCGQVGHFANKCTKPKKNVCFKCQGEGHISRNCPKLKPMDRGEVNQVASRRTSTLTKYLKKALVGDQTWNAMIDMGSSDCTIKATAALMGNYSVIRRPSELRGFGNSNNVVLSPGIIEAAVEVDGVRVDKVAFRIIPDDVQLQHDVLIGRTFTDHSTVAYVKIGEELRFTLRDTLLDVLPEMTNEEAPTRVRVEHETQLQPASIHLIEFEHDHQEIVLPIVNWDTREHTVSEGQTIDAAIFSIERTVCEMTPRNDKVSEDEVNTEGDISAEQRHDLMDLMDKYRVCVAKNIEDLGKTDLIEMDIQIKPGSVPVASKPYRANILEREQIRSIVDEWKRVGIVRETSSPYASPVALVKKKNGENRLVVDYRKLNAQTERVNFPLPNMDEFLEVLSGAKLFATLDLAHGYLQLPLKEEARHLTAFITPDDTGEFTRAIFGLMNAPFYFAKLMEFTLGPLRNRILLCYLDDILVIAENWNQLLERLEEVFKALVRAGLTLNLKKCYFGMRRVEYLGFVVSERGIEPGPRKMEAVEKFPRPSNVFETRRFLGLASYFRRFVPAFATIAKPMTELTRKDFPFVWGEKQEKAFVKLKQILSAQPVLAVYNAKAKQTELHTDASSVGLGAILLQSNEKDELHPVYAVSRRTSEIESRYHSSKLELIAIVWAVERLSVFLLPIKFLVVTDCEALVYLNKNKTQNPQVVRWANTLSEYEFEVKHRKGEAMQHVDALSRAPVGEPCEMVEAHIRQIVTRESEVLMRQLCDDRLNRKMKILEKSPESRTKPERDEVDKYVLRDGMLYRRVMINNQNREVFAVPSEMRKLLAIKYHDLSSHFGVDKVYARMRAYYHFPKMRTYIKRHISQCIECLMSKVPSGKAAGELHPIQPGNRPFALIHIDHVGPFLTSKRGNKYVLTIIDTLTKFTILEPVKSTNATMTVRKLEKFVEQFGAPHRIISDRGTGFTANKFEEFCKSHGIRHTLNSSRHPQANGLVERMNRTLLQSMIIRTEQGDNIEWEREIERIARDINLTISKATGRAPYEALYGYLPRFEDGATRALTEQCETHREPGERHDEIRENIAKAQFKYKRRYDERHYKNAKFEIGDLVFVRVNPIATGDSTKLQAKYRGPMIITNVYPSDTYEIERLTGARRSNRPTTAHVSQLRIWRGRDALTGETEILIDDNSAEESSEETNSDEIHVDFERSGVEQRNARSVSETSTTRPKRKTRQPKRYPEPC